MAMGVMATVAVAVAVAVAVNTGCTLLRVHTPPFDRTLAPSCLPGQPGELPGVGGYAVPGLGRAGPQRLLERGPLRCVAVRVRRVRLQRHGRGQQHVARDRGHHDVPRRHTARAGVEGRRAVVRFPIPRPIRSGSSLLSCARSLARFELSLPSNTVVSSGNDLEFLAMGQCFHCVSRAQANFPRLYVRVVRAFIQGNRRQCPTRLHGRQVLLCVASVHCFAPSVGCCCSQALCASPFGWQCTARRCRRPTPLQLVCAPVPPSLTEQAVCRGVTRRRRASTAALPSWCDYCFRRCCRRTLPPTDRCPVVASGNTATQSLRVSWC